MNRNLNLNLNLKNETEANLEKMTIKKNTEGIPLYPTETDNLILIDKWTEAFEDYATKHSL